MSWDDRYRDRFPSPHVFVPQKSKDARRPIWAGRPVRVKTALREKRGSLQTEASQLLDENRVWTLRSDEGFQSRDLCSSAL